ncbi:class I SAM-dependent methyltransferase [Dyella sp. EPa41]|uniref:class I SAM-dependent methyltransferase n=1 Tax=Dyella sp. EPa41 TaxID=1561194 RepID=UPI001F330FC0|nr:class I SAM-dependent methyltransferase [Dyella sp. EPa41]
MQRDSYQGSTSLSDRPERTCPVCGSGPEHARAFLEERIDASRLNQFSFASRKEPEFFNYRMIQCTTCDLVYVDRPPSQQALAHAYHVADYDSSEEANDAADAYMRELRPVLARLNRDSALEIGTGTGVLLDGLAAAGFRRLVGIEPSSAAFAAAPPHRRPWIREGIFREEDFEPESFDLVCCFMTLEHVRDPMEIARSVSRLLRPGGAFVTVTHNYRSAINRVLGRRSPIIDVEHMQLFSNMSIGELLTRAGYDEVQSRPLVNRYALAYWTRLLPFPSTIKRQLISFENAMGLGQRKLSFNVGNTIASGFRPADAGA